MSALYSKYTGASKVLGKAIASAREKKNLTQQDLGKLVGITRSTILRLEKGLTGTNRERLAQICEILEIDMQAMQAEVAREDAVDAAVRRAHYERGWNPVPKLIFCMLELSLEIPKLSLPEQEVLGSLCESMKKQIEYFKHLKDHKNGT